MATTNNGEYIRISKDGYLEIRQLVGKGRPSSTGKNLVVVSTGGFQAIEGSDVRLNLTAIRKS